MVQLYPKNVCAEYFRNVCYGPCVAQSENNESSFSYVPAHFDDLGLFEVESFNLIQGSAFTIVDAAGVCQHVVIEDDVGVQWP